MARATHIAVNLLLIVALTMQPGLAYAVQQDCSAGIAAGFICQGCGSCKVRLERARCSCCGIEASGDQDACCGDSDQHYGRHKGGDSAVTSDPFAGMKPEEGPTPQNALPENRSPQDSEQPQNAERPSGDDRGQLRAANVAALMAGCHCVTAPEPFDAPVPRSSAPELRDILTVDICFCDDAVLTARPPLAAAFDVADRHVVAHFSQIVFCIWRR